MRLWIDTDIGDDPDDTIALYCAARDPHVELVGVSTVAGEVDRRATMVRRLLPDVPVVAGPPPPEVVVNTDALLGIGPWTHVAQLAEADALPRRVVLMGGVIGKVKHHDEWREIEHNVASDPDAARRVLAMTGNLIVVPLDATARLFAFPRDEQIYSARIPGFADEVAQWRARVGDHLLVLHDPGALLVALGEKVSRMEARGLQVDAGVIMRASVDGPLQDVIAHLSADAIRARVRALVTEGD